MEPFLCILLLVGCLTAYVNGQCSGTPADIVVAVPGYWKIPNVEYEAFEENLINLFDHFDISRNQINIGLILYGNKPVRIIHPQPYKTRKQVNTRVTLMSQRYMNAGKMTRQDVAGAIKEMRAMLNSPFRPGARKIGVIFTYGAAPKYEMQNIIDQAAKAKQDGIVLYALSTNGTGQEFHRIGYDYCRLFSMGNFSHSLPSATSDLAKGICSEIDTSVQVVSGNCFPRAYGYVLKTTVTCNTKQFVSVPDPDNCAYYYTCETKRAKPSHLRCSAGTVYDPKVNGCNHLENTQCFYDFPCPPEVSQLLPYPGDCTKYIQCDSSGLHFLKDCALGTVFDFEWQSCNSTTKTTNCYRY